MLKASARLAMWLLVLLLISCSRYGYEQPERPCQGVSCSGHGECVLLGERPACQCDPGYHPEDLECVLDPNPCEGIGCSGNGQCAVTQAGEALCACDPGFRNDGPLACVPDPVDCLSDNQCDDGLFCNGVETCLSGNCTPGTAPDCSTLDGPCQSGACSESLGQCQPLFFDSLTSCNDGLFCNGGDSCDGAGNCQHTGDPCPPSDLCNELTDACDPVGTGGSLVQLSAGMNHACGLAGDGTILCWGSDSAGQLGNGQSQGDYDRPRPIDPTPLPQGTTFSQVACGRDFSCGLSHAGEVWCWGDDAVGQLGNDTGATPSQSPVPTALTGGVPIIQICAGDFSACALAADGTLRCWGNNLNGQIGDGTDTLVHFTPVPVSTVNVQGEQAFVQVSCGAGHACALTGGGIAYCWGDDLMGQLGDGAPPAASNLPVAVDLTPITGETWFRRIEAGTWISCGITSQGQAWCWGGDQWGTLGDGLGQSTSASPVPLDLAQVSGSRSFKQVCAASARACGLTADGRVYCWGNDDVGQLGNGGGIQTAWAPGPIDTAVIGGERSFAEISCGGSMTCGLTAQGATYCWGLDDLGQLGDGPGDASSHSPVAVDTTAVAVANRFVDIQAGISSSCGLTSRGEIWCWGSDGDGQLGDGGTPSDMPTPVLVDTSLISDDSAFIQMAVGYNHACALTGQGRAYCWGNPEYGSLGDGGLTPDNGLPYKVNTDGLINESHFIHIAAGNDHTCGLTADGVAWCWGFNWYGQVGNGTDGLDSWYDLPQEVDVSGNPGAGTFVMLAAGTDHSCGIASDGTAWCWGYDGSGALGNGDVVGGTTVPSEVVTADINGSRTFRQINAYGYEHTCGITAAGRSFCWGWNGHGEVGIGSPDASVQAPAPLDTSGITGSDFLESTNLGHWFSCGLTAEGVAYCWGDDFLGALGNGDLGDTLAPAPVDTLSMAGSTRFSVVSGGGFHTCGIATDGQAWCWGYNNAGQVGSGTVDNSFEMPQAVAWP